MKISRVELETLILEELREALEYPASELVQITSTIWKLADSLGIKTSDDERQQMVGELESLLNAEGFELREQRLMLGEPLDISLEGTALYALMQRIGQANPAAWNKILAAFEKGGIGTGLRDATVEKPEDDNTETTPPETVAPVYGELEVGDFIDVADEFGTKASKKHQLHKILKPGAYQVVSVDEDEDQPLTIVRVETGRAIKGLRHEDFLNYPKLFTIRQGDEELTQTISTPPVEPPEDEEEEGSFENPWAFKWFWEKGDAEDTEVPQELQDIPSGKDITIATLTGLGGAAGLYAVWKYLFGAEDDGDLPPGLAQSVGNQAQDLKQLTGIDVQDPQFIMSAIKWVLSLTLDEGQMKWVNRMEPLMKALRSADSDDPAVRQALETLLSDSIDKIPGIELIDKLPGGREKVVELMMNKWETMPTKERIDLVLMLAPEEYLEMLDQVLNASPGIGEIPGVNLPRVKTALYNWLDEGDINPAGPADFDKMPLWAFMILAGARLGLIDRETAGALLGVVHNVQDSLDESRQDGKVKRGMKLMKMLLQEQQLNRMKVLAGVK